MTVARRLYLYVLAFAGLLAVLYATAGILAQVVTTTVGTNALLGAGDLRARASLYLAALVVGLPVWLGLWLVAERLAARSPDERAAPERRLFLAAVFAVTAVVALVALRDVLRAVLTFPGGRDTARTTTAGIAAAARLLVYGAAWLGYSRVARRTLPEAQEATERGRPHDLAIYLLSGVALAFLAIGLGSAARQLIQELLRLGEPRVLAGTARDVWTVWGAIAAWILSGGLVWGVVWRYDLTRGGRRELRVAYLYLVMLAVVPATLGGGGAALYEFVRRAFGYRAPYGGAGDFLRDTLPPLAVGGAIWAYHWAVLRRQAALDAPAPGARDQAWPAGAGIPWPRRPVLALLALTGLAITAPALVSLLWLALDGLLNTRAALGGVAWWRDRLSVSIAAGLIGAVTWLGAWSILQRAALADPGRERTAEGRRLLLSFVTLTGLLVAIGFLIALLWLVFRTLLGDPLGPTGLSRALKHLSAALVAGLLAAYHGAILRHDLRLAGPSPTRVRVVALVAPGAEGTLDALRARSRLRIDIAGHQAEGATGGQLDLATLGERLAALGTDELHDHALLTLYPDSGTLYLYRK